MAKENILVTGASGYIGSVVTERLLEEGYQVIALDKHQVVSSGADNRADMGGSLDSIFFNYQIKAVIHLAADSIVSESMNDPRKYFHNNVVKSINLLNTMMRHSVNKIVFSSSASVYGIPTSIPITEESPVKPINPYGETKAMFEKVLDWYGKAYKLDAISLRYFNAAGATSTHGEDHEPETHLIPNILKVASGETDKLSIFGDGSCVRDYIHVLDIADAHLKALNRTGDGFRAYNLGSEKGYSVKEVVKMVERVTGIYIALEFEHPRPGDPPILVASSKLAREEIGWFPKYGLQDIVKSAWKWQTKQLEKQEAFR